MLLMQPVAAAEPASAEPAPEAVAAPASEVPPEAPAPADDALLLPKATPIVIAIDQALGSKISVAGETFPIRLVQPVVVDGIEVLPAGIRGEGQVVHAKKAGIGGAAGELVLAARWLEHDGRRIPLRSFRFLAEGELSLSKGVDNVGAVNATMAIVSPLAIFIGGGNTNVPPGTVAGAKTRDDERFARSAPAADAPSGDQASQQEGPE
ncbi:hypothetical protein ACLBKU_15400 [Erythrobacter sp. NE805]|uniref:hypothetical protein n=1 Tax=Erythrobacter sp. NE805 TaxID=3389875 RepID=UPI00396B31B0